MRFRCVKNLSYIIDYVIYKVIELRILNHRVRCRILLELILTLQFDYFRVYRYVIFYKQESTRSIDSLTKIL